MNESLKAHHYADIFPMIEGEAWAEFVQDIRINGVDKPIVLHDGMILDGRNRYKAAMQLGIKCPSKPYEGADPLAYVLSANLHRRQLTTKQRAAVAAELANLSHGTNQHQKKLEGENSPSTSACTVTLEQAAKMMNVDRKSVVTAKKIMREDPEQHERDKAGIKTPKTKPAPVATPQVVQAAPQPPAQHPELVVPEATQPAPHPDPVEPQEPEPEVITEQDKESMSESRSWKNLYVGCGLASVDAMTREPDRSYHRKRFLAALGWDKFPGRPDDEQWVQMLEAVTILAAQTGSHPIDVRQARIDAFKAFGAKRQEDFARLLEQERMMIRLDAWEAVRAEWLAKYPNEMDFINQEKARLSEDRKKAREEHDRYRTWQEGLTAQMKYEDYQFLRMLLHPDRAPAGFEEKFTKAFRIIQGMDEYMQGTKKKA